MEEYCVQQDDMRKCENNSVIPQCDISPEDDQGSQCQQTYGRGEEHVLVNAISENDLTIHLASSGIAGIAAAAAISSARSRNKPYSFETIPAVRKRQATRLMRKITSLIDEYSVRVGQQISLVICNPRVAHKSQSHLDSPSSNTLFKVYGSSPLEGVVRNLRPILIQELDSALRNYQAMHEQSGLSSSIWASRSNETLPPLMVDGIPTPLDKMTQAQLRAFIPVMLKYSTNRGKPGWGRPHARPPWWPAEVPWANVRSDVRTPEEKAQVSWTAVLKKVVRMCYEYHGREDLLQDYAPNVNGTLNATQILDMDGNQDNQQAYMLAPGSVMDGENRSNVYTMGLMHMPTSESMTNAGHFTPFAPQTYEFKTENDGSISIIPYAESQKPEVASMEAAATLDEYNVESVKYNPQDSMTLSNYANGGDMVSLPAETMMQLENESSLYHIIANNSRMKASRINNQANDKSRHE